jgi:hypothetical protein
VQRNRAQRVDLHDRSSATHIGIISPPPAGRPTRLAKSVIGVDLSEAHTPADLGSNLVARVTVVTAPERLFGSRPGGNKPWLVPCHTTFALSGSAWETRQCGYRHLSQSLNSGVASVAAGRVGEPWRHLVAVDTSR